ncbi:MULTISPECIES: 2-deoxyribose-5-phosphate aldolase [unclassified Synechococcus]|uniref:2-deoxyribose-5-phosphate aldolase n=1 Tax=unclassified Synechococcus TaxID=2626047 RepID=UPI0039B013BE
MTKSPRRQELPDIPPLIHQALLNPLLQEEELLTLCDAAKQLGFGGVCVSLIHLEAVRRRLGGHGPVKLIATVAFPFGALPTELKQAQAEWAAARGAEVLEVTPDWSALVNGRANSFAEELAAIAALDLPMNVVLDINHLTAAQLALAAEAAVDAGAASLQAGNGFGAAVSADQIRELRHLTRGRCGIKAAGGIRELEHAVDLVGAGATALGTGHGPALMKALRQPR